MLSLFLHYSNCLMQNNKKWKYVQRSREKKMKDKDKEKELADVEKHCSGLVQMKHQARRLTS